MSRFRSAPIQSGIKGFTIIELLIASSVFAVILIIITVGIIHITQSYTKGVTETETQNVARNIVNDITQAIQLNGGDVTPTTYPVTAGNVYGFCIGDREYIYQVGYEVVSSSQSTLSSHQSYNGIIVNPESSDCPSLTNVSSMSSTFLTAKTLPAGFSELLTPSMRLSYLNICQGYLSSSDGSCTPSTDPTSDLYSIGVQVTYGDDYVLTSPPTDTNGTTLCAGSAESQFCATSKLITVVEKRIS
jgi:prepilin-type N-terminal cleavage/methylation domain-containing protein